jgi:hypothetical protein
VTEVVVNEGCQVGSGAEGLSLRKLISRPESSPYTHGSLQHPDDSTVESFLVHDNVLQPVEQVRSWKSTIAISETQRRTTRHRSRTPS